MLEKMVSDSARRWNKETKRALRKANAESFEKGRKPNILPYILALAAGISSIIASNIPYFQKKETQKLIQYIHNSKKEMDKYNEIILPAKQAERDSIMNELNPVDEIACYGCSLNKIRTYLKEKKKVEESIVEKLGYADIDAAKKIAARFSKVKVENIPIPVLIGKIYVENRKEIAKNKCYISKTGCIGATGISRQNARKYSKNFGKGDPKKIYSNIEMADWLYEENAKILGDEKWKLIVAHAIGGPKIKDILEKSGADNYVDAKSSKFWSDKSHFGKNKYTKALSDYVEKISVAYDISKNYKKYTTMINERESARIAQASKRKGKQILYAQK